MADSAASISSLNPTAAEALRSAYQRAAASASSRASSRYSSSVATSSRRVNSAPRLRPRNGPRPAGVDSLEPCPDLGGPLSLRVGVDLCLETLNQLASESGPFFIGQPKRLDEQLFGIHESRLSRHSELRRSLWLTSGISRGAQGVDRAFGCMPLASVVAFEV